MGKYLKSIWSYIYGFNGLTLIIYCLLVFITAAIPVSNGSIVYMAITLAFFAFVLSSVVPFILKKISSVQLNHRNYSFKYVSDFSLKILLFTIPFLVLLFCFFTYYPGGFSNDSFSQYGQTLDNSYNDWHPVAQTIVTFKLPLTLTNGWVGSIVLFQIILLSLALGYTFYVTYKHSNIAITTLTIFFILSNPQILHISLFPWKDVTFAIGALFLTSFSIQIYFSNGNWLKSPYNAALFVLVSALTTLFRHNAILFTLPLIFAILLTLKPKKALAIGLSILALITIIKGPIYTVINVEKPDKRQIETLGLPMTIIGAVVAKTPEALDEETKEFAYKIATKEFWEENYTMGSYNSVKFDDDTNNMVIEEYGTKQVLLMMITCIKNSPLVSLTALIRLTEGVYSISSNCIKPQHVYIENNEYNIVTKENVFFKEICRIYNDFYTNNFNFSYYLLGLIHLVLIITILAKFKINKSLNWKKLLFVAPMFCYNYGTTLLLTGVDDAARFFYYTYLIAPLLLVFIFKKEERNETDIAVSEAL